MGCRFEVLIDVERSPYDAFSCGAVIEEIGELICDWHDRLTVFSPASVTSRINAHPAHAPVAVDVEMFELLRLCEALREQTLGAFNIAAGTLMHAHGFRGNGPDRTSLRDLDLAHAITLDDSAMSVTRNDPRVALDFGAIGKGFVLDLIASELRGHGIEHAFVHGGTSSAIGLGSEAASCGWVVRVGESPVCDVRLSGSALGVSEISGRTLGDGETGHVMDPGSGAPASVGVARIACVHPSAAVADAYSTALNVKPELAGSLQEHGCSVVIFPSSSHPSSPHSARVFDRVGVIDM